MPRQSDQDDDLFADSRMTFGEHLEELRARLISAIKGLMFFLVIGFVLDGIGYWINVPWFGIGKPMMHVITVPVERELKAFYFRRMQRLVAEQGRGEGDGQGATALKPVKMKFPPEAIAALRGVKDLPTESIEATVLLDPIQTYNAAQGISQVIRPPELATFSVTETMMVYIKVSLLCGLVLASPWVFGQMWAFIGAGLYPHEKKYVHKFLPMSLGLFLGGVALCQFAVIPKSIAALLWFNDWIGFTPELRLNEWLSFAIMLPLVFGISFQTPLVMLALERIGIMSVAGYWNSWRMAAFLLAVFAMIIVPSPDALSMLAMWFPLVGLYFFGILLCKWAGRNDPVDEDVPEMEEFVEA
jgi:sec-independent protein translocase protein TatC